MSSQLNFQTSVSQKQQIRFLHSTAQPKYVSLCWNFSLAIFDFVSCSGILFDQKSRKVLLLFKSLYIQNHKSSEVLLHLSIGVSTDNFKPERDPSFLQFLELIRYIEHGVLIDEMWQKVY